MRYVVTGAAGFIGSHLAEALLAAGHEVVAVDSFTDYYERSRKERNAAALDVLELDLAEAPLEPILAGADGVFHLAGQPGVRASWGESFELYLDRNVLATQRLFEAAAAAGVRVVFASSSSVYGDAERYPTAEDVAPQPISPYGITKLACEQLARRDRPRQGLDAVLLRYFTVYGPRQRPDMAFTAMLEALARGDELPALRRRQRRAELHLRRRRGRGDDRGDGARPRRRGLQRRRRRRGDDERGDRARRGDLRTQRSTSSGEAAAGDVRRTKADVTQGRSRARLVAADRPRGGHAGAVALGGGRVARVNRPEPVPDPDAEREVDLRSVWERIAARWWLPVLGLVLGAVVGFALALGGGKVYEAETLVAMGQPFSPNGGAPVQSFLTNARAVSEIVRSEARSRRPRTPPACACARCAATSAPRSWAHPGPARGRRARRSSRSRSSRRSRGKAEQAADALAKEVIDAHVGEVRRHEDQGVQRPARLDPGAAEHARAADRAARAGGQRAAASQRSTSSSS